MHTLAIGTPPNGVIAVVCFIVAGILAAVTEPKASRWWPVFLCAGLAALSWPW